MSVIRLKSDQVPEGEGILIEAEGKRIALFCFEGRFFALDDTCPHRGVPLHKGLLREGVVACPWHLWQFQLESGVSPVNSLSKVRTYAVQLEGNEILLDVS